jgi:hypothetical protein
MNAFRIVAAALSIGLALAYIETAQGRDIRATK